MEPSRAQINRMGEILISSTDDMQKVMDAQKVIDTWRENHFIPLNALKEELDVLFHGMSIFVTSSRVKRLVSIEDKLRNNSTMRLGGVHDIGGLRYVFADMDSLTEAMKRLSAHESECFECVKNRDYVASPKESGYRSVHYIFKFHHENPKYDGMHVELQIRTRLQHSWAMAVETVSMIERLSLKADRNDGLEWREFFKIASAVFAKKEDSPVERRFANLSSVDLCNLFVRHNANHRDLLSQIEALSVVVEKSKQEFDDGYYLLTLDIDRKMVRVRSYPADDREYAAEAFASIEKIIGDGKVALLVSLSRMQEIHNAYPSYFLDVRGFIDTVKDFYRNCMK